jgi:excisionase family DNA binding protein
MSHTDEYLTVHETAERLRVSDKTVYRAVESGEFPAVKVGRVIRVPADFIAKGTGGADPVPTTPPTSTDSTTGE